MSEKKSLHDCLDCKGCIYEDWCKEDDEKFDSGLLEEDE